MEAGQIMPDWLNDCAKGCEYHINKKFHFITIMSTRRIMLSKKNITDKACIWRVSDPGPTTGVGRRMTYKMV